MRRKCRNCSESPVPGRDLCISCIEAQLSKTAAPQVPPRREVRATPFELERQADGPPQVLTSPTRLHPNLDPATKALGVQIHLQILAKARAAREAARQAQIEREVDAIEMEAHERMRARFDKRLMPGDLPHILQSAIKRLEKYGVPRALIPYFDAVILKGEEGLNAAMCQSNQLVEINTRHEFWKNPGGYMLLIGPKGEGHNSTDDTAHFIYHEVGHALRKASEDPPPAGWQSIAAEISNYSTESPNEFVAEVFAGLVTGRWFSRKVLKLYDQLGGWRKKQEPVDAGVRLKKAFGKTRSLKGLAEELRLKRKDGPCPRT
jgi:hypothetical protein